jgi:sugar/nucleoside kinase (ribokinase family)
MLSVADYDDAYFDAARHLHVTGVMPAVSASAGELVEHAMRAARTRRHDAAASAAATPTISFDPNLRPALWPDVATMRTRLNALAALADWVLPGFDEGCLLSGRDSLPGVAAHFHAMGVRVVVVKLGAQGAWLSTDGGATTLTVPGVAVPRVVDTVGAGDGFAAGLIGARLDGRDWAAALARANWVGAQVIQQRGDIDGLPRCREWPADG